jgi:SNF2 family DNA or RNA helicase
MDRIHRLGQHRPVQAIKLVIEDSIESRIVQLQEKKSAMVDAAVSVLLIYYTLASFVELWLVPLAFG